MESVTVTQLAERLGMPRRTVLAIIERMGIPTRRVGRAHLLTPANARRVKPGKRGRPKGTA